MDATNNRVLVYANAASTSTLTASAAHVLGQLDFPYNSPNCIEGKEFYFGTGFSGSADAGLAIDTSGSTPQLYVSDSNNHRVLGFKDARIIKPGMKADLVIGQPDLQTAVCNYGGMPMLQVNHWRASLRRRACAIRRVSR